MINSEGDIVLFAVAIKKMLGNNRHLFPTHCMSELLNAILDDTK
jgi:hypothetical protein